MDEATTRGFRHPTTGEKNNASSLNNKQSAGTRINQLHSASNAALTTFNTPYATSTNSNLGITSAINTSGAQYLRATTVPSRSSVEEEYFLGSLTKYCLFSNDRIKRI